MDLDFNILTMDECERLISKDQYLVTHLLLMTEEIISARTVVFLDQFGLGLSAIRYNCVSKKSCQVLLVRSLYSFYKRKILLAQEFQYYSVANRQISIISFSYKVLLNAIFIHHLIHFYYQKTS